MHTDASLLSPSEKNPIYQIIGSSYIGTEMVEFRRSSKDIPVETASSAAIEEIAEAFSYATHIGIQGCLSTKEMPKLFQVLQGTTCRLEKLYLSDCELTLDDFTKIADVLKANVVPLQSLDISPMPAYMDETKITEMFLEVMKTNSYLQHCFIGGTALEYGASKDTFEPLFERNLLVWINQSLTLQALCLKQFRSDGGDAVSIQTTLSCRLGIEIHMHRDALIDAEVLDTESSEQKKEVTVESTLDYLDLVIAAKEKLQTELFPDQPIDTSAA
jgi:hypothetical protein